MTDQITKHLDELLELEAKATPGAARGFGKRVWSRLDLPQGDMELAVAARNALRPLVLALKQQAETIEMMERLGDRPFLAKRNAELAAILGLKEGK